MRRDAIGASQGEGGTLARASLDTESSQLPFWFHWTWVTIALCACHVASSLPARGSHICEQGRLLLHRVFTQRQYCCCAYLSFDTVSP